MNKRIGIVVLVALVVVLGTLAAVLGGLCVYKNRQVLISREKAAAAEAAAEVASVGAETVRERSTELAARTSDAREQERELARLRAKVTQLESTLAAVRSEQRTAEKKDAKAKPADSQPPMANIAEMLKNPAMKDMIKAQQKSVIDMQYGSLFKYLELSNAQQDALKELLVSRQMELMDAGLAMMDGDVSAEEKQAKAERMKALTETYKDKIKELLGEDAYAVYEEFEETQPERMQVNFFKQSLGADHALTEDQEHKLILAMHDESENFTFSSSLNDQENFDGSELTPDVMEKHMQEMVRLQENYISRAGDILSEPQVEQFKKTMQQQRAMQEMGLKMAQQMFAAPKGETKEE